jgi:hypothetical protein
LRKILTKKNGKYKIHFPLSYMGKLNRPYNNSLTICET